MQIMFYGIRLWIQDFFNSIDSLFKAIIFRRNHETFPLLEKVTNLGDFGTNSLYIPLTVEAALLTPNGSVLLKAEGKGKWIIDSEA